MPANPLDSFLAWYEEAKCGSPIDPDIVALATATPEGRPSVRMVLFRGLREGGFSFFTNYQSRKGLELAENPFAAIVFYWAHLGGRFASKARSNVCRLGLPTHILGNGRF